MIRDIKPPTRLLLVEDDPEVACAIARILRAYRYGVHVIGCCAELPPAGAAFDVGVFDIDLSDGDGVALAHAALANRVVRRVVFFSGVSDPGRVRSALELGPLTKKMDGVMPLIQQIRSALVSNKRRVSGEQGGDVLSSYPPPPSGTRLSSKDLAEK